MFRILFGLALLLAPLTGNELPQQEPQLVDFNVVAVDSHGAPITDLTRDDFRVTDNGKPRTIAFFHHHENHPREVLHLGPNEYSNRSAANVPRATVILFDLMNEEFGTRGTTANRLVQSLESLPSADYVYLYLLTMAGKLYAIHGLPGAEGEIPPEDGGPWTRHAKPLLDQALRAVLQVRPVDVAVDITYRIELTYLALDALASQLSSVPGRKSIVWLSDGVPLELGPRRSDTGDVVDFTPQLRQMSEAFDRSGVSIYPVRQVMLGSPSNLDGANRTGLDSLDTLDEFAGMTGGRQDAGKDIAPAVRQAISDTSTSYEMGFYPDEKSWDNKFHKLRVTCARKGVRIQARTGYYAWKQPPGERSTQAILSAIAPRFDAAEIGLRASLRRDPQAAGVLRLDARIDAHDIALVHQGDAYTGELRVGMAGYVAGAQPESGPVTPLNLHFDAPARQRALDEGIPYARNLKLGENIAAVRLIVYDRSSNAIGSVTIPVPPADPGKPN